MKKKIIIAAVIIVVFLLTCLYIYQNKDNNKYGLVELTGQELLQVFIDKEDASITFALYNDRDVQAEEFYEDLETTARQAHQYIYYVNTTHTTFEFQEIMNTLTSRSSETLAYYVIQDGKILLSNTYKNFDTMYKDLNGKKYETKVEKMSKEEKLEYIDKARKSYDEGDIASAHNYLSNAWDLKEAKTEWQTHPYYNLIGNWEQFEVQPDGKNTRYVNLFFTSYASPMYFIDTTLPIENFQEPPFEEYKGYDIQIKDNHIYIKNEKNNKYQEKYEIISIGMYQLEISNGNDTYTFQYGY